MIDSNTLTYTPFSDHRKHQGSSFETGQSGKLLVGTDINGKKYIIKHCHPHNAANEYVACWLAKKLGVPAPSAYLLSPNKVFQSKYAVAIEFLDLKPFDKHAAPYPDDLIAQFALSSLIVQDDIIQLNVAGEHIVSYDFSESFSMPEMNSILHMTSINSQYSHDSAISIIRQRLATFRRYLSVVDFNVPGLAREFNLDCEKMREGMMAIGKKVLLISENEINEMSEELENLYPMEVSVYYEECIYAMQEHMKKF